MHYLFIYMNFEYYFLSMSLEDLTQEQKNTQSIIFDIEKKLYSNIEIMLKKCEFDFEFADIKKPLLFLLIDNFDDEQFVVNMIDLLKQKNYKFNYIDAGKTELMHAIINGKFLIALKLLENNLCDINKKDDKNNTALIYAINSSTYINEESKYYNKLDKIINMLVTKSDLTSNTSHIISLILNLPDRGKNKEIITKILEYSTIQKNKNTEKEVNEYYELCAKRTTLYNNTIILLMFYMSLFYTAYIISIFYHNSIFFENHFVKENTYLLISHFISLCSVFIISLIHVLHIFNHLNFLNLNLQYLLFIIHLVFVSIIATKEKQLLTKYYNYNMISCIIICIIACCLKAHIKYMRINKYKANTLFCSY